MKEKSWHLKNKLFLYLIEFFSDCLVMVVFVRAGCFVSAFQFFTDCMDINIEPS